MAITYDQNTAKDLIETKVDDINSTIERILNKWDQSEPITFIELTKQEKLSEEAIRDEIAMRQLLSEQKKYQNLLREKME